MDCFAALAMTWRERRCCRVGKGALSPCPPSIRDDPREWWARFALPTLRPLATAFRYHASMHGRFFVVRASGFGTDRKPAMIHCRVSAGSITSSISSTEAIETALPLA